MVEAGLFARELEIEGIDDGSNDGPEFDTAQYLHALGLSFIRDAVSRNAFSKLSRYETSILRALHRYLHELQRLQAARQGEAAQSPIAVAVTIDAASELVHGASE